MTRKKKGKVEEWKIDQEVIRTGVRADMFDLLLRFTDNNTQPEILMDETVKMMIEGLTQRYGTIVVKVNWFAQGLMVIAPNEVPGYLMPREETSENAQEGTSEALQSTVDSDLSPTITLEN